ncbi:MAG TPA: serine hydrolase [Acidobacteriaceae bacterium]|nr:serine hydrolase [Acidobacteriaceae bacterium]
MGVVDFVEDVLTDLHLITPSTVDPFPSAYALTFDTSNASFNACQTSATAAAAVKDLCGAVVDLTGNPANPVYAGHNDNDMLYCGSMVKMFTMYVAFELKARVQKQAKNMIAGGLSTATAGWENKVYAELRKAWKPKLDAAFPGLPSGMPDFKTIFQLSNTGDATFPTQKTAADIDNIGEFGTPAGLYGDWMKLMLRWSNNTAAGQCIFPLSYSYLNGVLGSAGFFDSATKKGLWVSGDYRKHDWVKGPGNKGGQALAPRFATAQGRTKSNFTGTAFQVARLLTLMAQGKLIDATSSADMISSLTQGILDPSTGKSGTVSFIGDALAAASRPVSEIRGKIGFGNDSFAHDCGIIRVDRGADPARTLRFIEVVLGAAPTNSAGFDQLAVAYYDCVTAQHP